MTGYRPALFRSLEERLPRGPALVITGPPGAGKTTLLLELAQGIRARGAHAVVLDLLGAASSPERFLPTVTAALPPDPRVEAVAARATQGRGGSADAVHALFDLLAGLDQVGGREVVLLLDEVTEIRSLAYFPGLRHADAALGDALAARPRGTLAATSFPTLAARTWPQLATLALAPLTAAEIGGREADAVARLSGGWPRYVEVLRAAPGSALATWRDEMARGGRLETLCRATYESLLLRSRGYGISKAVLAAVAEEEGLNLTALVGRIGRTPGATRDYLGWLLAVDALASVEKRYRFVDPLVRTWVRLHARGVPATAAEIAAAGEELLGSAPPTAPAPEAEEAPAIRPRRRDTLVEID